MPITIVAAAVILLPVIVVLGSLLVWWVKNVGRHKFPQPFLGEGSNAEWAESKRAELAEGGPDFDPQLSQFEGPIIVPSDGIESKSHSLTLDSVESRDNGDKSGRMVHEASNELMQQWLEETGHTDDDWAEKLLGDREPSEHI